MVPYKAQRPELPGIFLSHMVLFQRYLLPKDLKIKDKKGDGCQGTRCRYQEGETNGAPQAMTAVDGSSSRNGTNQIQKVHRGSEV